MPLGTFVPRLTQFLVEPRREKKTRLLIWRVLRRIAPSQPICVRLPYGGWWSSINDVASQRIFCQCMDVPEWKWMVRFLREGMTAVDIGAHHGFYTILMSKAVGASGRVIAFEPSPRERERLAYHLRLNRCGNVSTEPLAVSDQSGEAALFVCQGRETGCNSLRPPNVSESTQTVTVTLTTLQDYLRTASPPIPHIDLIKIDAEGSELKILKGCGGLLKSYPRPIILCEVDDSRTRAFGYLSGTISSFLRGHNYALFGLTNNGVPTTIEKSSAYNTLAVPEERLYELGMTALSPQPSSC